VPKVSVIIPCYNLGEYLDEAVDSVLGQTYTDYEIILVDDGSTDPFTRERVAAQQAKPRVKVFTTENQGLARTRNFGIEQSRGIYICCLDADDRYHRDFLAECVAFLDGDSEEKTGFVTTKVKVFGEQNAYWGCADYHPAWLLIENNVHVASLFRGKCWQEVGGYDTKLTGFQDWNFWIAIISKGYRWERIKRPLFQYRVRAGSMLEGSEKKRRSLKQIIVENNLDYFKELMPEVLDLYEAKIELIEQRSREKEVAVAKSALEKLQKLYAEHQRLKQQHQALLEEVRKTRRR
jgi:glycosyltransferase involved in cell wall biosynthesis